MEFLVEGAPRRIEITTLVIAGWDRARQGRGRTPHRRTGGDRGQAPARRALLAVGKMLPPRELLARFAGSPKVLAPGTAMFCGTLAVQGEIGGGERFEIELHDPVKNRSLRHSYAIRALEIAD
jgi:hypothetical protein